MLWTPLDKMLQKTLPSQHVPMQRMPLYSLFFWKWNLEDCLGSLQSYCTLGSCHTFVHPRQHVGLHIRHWLSRIVLRKDGWWLGSVMTFGWALGMHTSVWLVCLYIKAQVYLVLGSLGSCDVSTRCFFFSLSWPFSPVSRMSTQYSGSPLYLHVLHKEGFKVQAITDPNLLGVKVVRFFLVVKKTLVSHWYNLLSLTKLASSRIQIAIAPSIFFLSDRDECWVCDG